MADLGSKTTDKRLAFEKYVISNKRFKEAEFVIEKGKIADVYKKNGSKLEFSNKKLKSGTKIEILDQKLYEIAGLKLCSIKASSIKGFIQINCIRKPTSVNTTQYEDEVVNDINNFIHEAGGSIDIKLKGDSKIYKNISFAVKVNSKIKSVNNIKADPKADIILCKDIKKPIEDTSIFISHKKAGGPEAFQQYGGLSKQAGKNIYENSLVQKFLEYIGKLLEDSGDNKLPNPVLGKFDNDNLSNMLIYGPDYGSKFSLQHVQIIGQGKPILQNKGKYYVLDFSNHISLSGDLSNFKGGYLPVFGATFRVGRGFELNGKKYSGARVGIYPQKMIETRSGLITYIIK